MSIVRSSKYRHVFGTAFKREECYENLRVSISAWDTNFVTANPKYLCLNWNAGGGGAFIVIPHDQAGKLRGDFPLFSAHAGAVLDTAFSPFDDDVVASGAEDHKAMVWRVPRGLAEREEDVTEPIAVLGGHGRKVGHVAWNPVARDVLAVSSSDHTVRIWDVEKQAVGVVLEGFKDTVLSIAWSPNGSQLAVACRDKVLRIFDARSGQCLQQGQSHLGVKGSRVVWVSPTRLVTTGFSRTSDRQLNLWDSQNLSKPLLTRNIDMSAGMLIPFFDACTQMLYVGGKGDGNIRYYEFADDTLYELATYSSTEPQRGLGVMPKRGVDVVRCEVMRFFKVVGNSTVEPISFKVPRKAESFQADIYPPAHAGVPALSAEEFFAGKDAEPLLVDMELLYESGPLVVGESAGGKPVPVVSAPVPVVSAPAPAAASASAAVPAPVPAPAPASAPVAVKEPAREPARAPSPSSVARSSAPTPSSPRQQATDQSQLHAVTAELDALRDTNQQLQAELAQAKSSYQAHQKDLANAQSQVAQIQSEHAQATGAHARALEQQKQAAEAELVGITQQLLEAETQAGELRGAVEESRGEAEELRALAKGLEAEAVELRRRLEEAVAEAEGRESEAGRLRKELVAAIGAANSLAVAAERAADCM